MDRPTVRSVRTIPGGVWSVRDEPGRGSRPRRLARLSLGLGLLVVLTVPFRATAVEPDPSQVEVRRDVAYAEESPQQVLDVYLPAAAPGRPAPMVIMVHGGGWRSGDKALLAPASQALAQRGLVVLNVDYRLGSEGKPAYQRQVADVRSALAWARKNGEEMGANPDDIAMVGVSAGGHLVAMAALDSDRTSTPVQAVVSLSGPMDIPALVDSLRQSRQDGPCSGAECKVFDSSVSDLRMLLGCDPFKCSQKVLEAASPISYVSPAAPAFLIANGSDEILPVEQAREMAKALESDGVQVRSVVVPGDEHGLAYARLIRKNVYNFLVDHLGPAPDASTTPAAAEADANSRFRGLGVGLVVLALLGAAGVGVARVLRR